MVVVPITSQDPFIVLCVTQHSCALARQNGIHIVLELQLCHTMQGTESTELSWL